MNDSMHDKHDLDLISALVEGDLPDPSAAEELVSSCRECARLYRAHLTVREAVRAEPPPQMTEAERARVRTALWRELEEPATKPSRTRTSWWYRAVPAAAALVVVAGVAGSVYLDGFGGDAATEAASDTTAVADETQEDATALSPLSESYSTSDGADATEAPAETMPAADDAGEPRVESAPSDLSELEDAANAFRERVESGDVEILEEFDCDPPRPGDGDILAAEEIQLEGGPTWLAAFGKPGEVATVVVYRPTDCEVLFADGQGP